MKIFLYPVIDMPCTGRHLLQICRLYGKSARTIQNELGLASVQSVYDWFHGKTLPSLENMHALSQLLDLDIEQLLIGKHGFSFARYKKLEDYEKRMLYYRIKLRKNMDAAPSLCDITNAVHEDAVYNVFWNKESASYRLKQPPAKLPEAVSTNFVFYSRARLHRISAVFCISFR